MLRLPANRRGDGELDRAEQNRTGQKISGLGVEKKKMWEESSEQSDS